MSGGASGQMTAKLQRPRPGDVDPAAVRGKPRTLPGEISPRARKGDAKRRSEKSAEAVIADREARQSREVFDGAKGRTSRKAKRT
jgi:hypothetical protein